MRHAWDKPADSFERTCQRPGCRTVIRKFTGDGGYQFWPDGLTGRPQHLMTIPECEAPKVPTVRGRDIQPGQVVKIHGRWLRIVSWADDGFPMRFAVVARPQEDPRLTSSVTGRWRLIHAEDDYPTRNQPAPVWEHVTRQIERETAKGLR